ncbi:MAG TPA: ROK family glucokinase [Bacillota bacterium]|nr:ROK family glucokinase [Bacillota bacterium]
MTKKFYFGIDLGGTSIKMGVISVEGKLLLEREQPTPKGPYLDVLHVFKRMMHQLLDGSSISNDEIMGVGVGVPALLDVESGYVHEIVNLGWKDVPLQRELENLFNLPCFIDNDANTAALGEMWQGAGRNAKQLICITVGTGIGGGLILNGDIYHGAIGMAGEIGHMCVATDKGRLCNCGQSGCLETEASATAIIHYGKQAILEGKLQHPDPEHLTAKDVIDAARTGNIECNRIIQQVSYYLALALAQAAAILNPEKIIIGGGVSNAGQFFIQPIRHYFEQFALKKIRENVRIVPAELGNKAGMIGAAWLVHNHCRQIGGI